MGRMISRKLVWKVWKVYMGKYGKYGKYMGRKLALKR